MALALYGKLSCISPGCLQEWEKTISCHLWRSDGDTTATHVCSDINVPGFQALLDFNDFVRAGQNSNGHLPSPGIFLFEKGIDAVLQVCAQFGGGQLCMKT